MRTREKRPSLRILRLVWGQIIAGRPEKRMMPEGPLIRVRICNNPMFEMIYMSVAQRETNER